jgi:RNA polymerase sigma-70 factor (ECF subfamily)
MIRPAFRALQFRLLQPDGDLLASPSSARIGDESRLLRGLRAGEESAFVELVDRYAGAMLRVARLYVRNESVAEEIVQEAWLNVLKGIEGFEGRSSLRTWIFVILGNCARKRLPTEGRSVPLASLGGQADEPSVPEDRFFPTTHPRWAGMWSTLVDAWDEVPEEELLGAEAQAQLRSALEAIPVRYATVFVLRDVEGWSSEEVAALLAISVENQRVLLHRARARIRAALEGYFEQRKR